MMPELFSDIKIVKKLLRIFPINLTYEVRCNRIFHKGHGQWQCPEYKIVNKESVL